MRLAASSTSRKVSDCSPADHCRPVSVPSCAPPHQLRRQHRDHLLRVGRGRYSPSGRFVDATMTRAGRLRPPPSRASRTQQERREDTRARLLAATIECLVEHGYAGTTTQRVQDRAGLSRGALLHHFATKEALLVAAVSHVADAQISAVRAEAAGRCGERGRAAAPRDVGPAVPGRPRAVAGRAHRARAARRPAARPNAGSGRRCASCSTSSSPVARRPDRGRRSPRPVPRSRADQRPAPGRRPRPAGPRPVGRPGHGCSGRRDQAA